MTHALSNPEIPFLREPRDKALLFSILESAARHAADFRFEITRPPVDNIKLFPKKIIFSLFYGPF